jgi:hypothetical protein
MRLLFDFDGVLMNSCHEASLAAYRAVTAEPVTRLEDLPEGCLRLFERNRHFFVPAGEALPLMRWCLSKLNGPHDAMLTPDEWQRVKDLETLSTGERSRLFFKSRQAIVDYDREAWLPLSQPYQPIWDAIKPVADQIIILTNKNRTAVLDLTEYWKLPVRPENIFAADGGASKTDNLAVILQREQRGDWMFIDDQLTNLLKISEFISQPLQSAEYNRFDLALAGWGYCDDNMRSASQRMSFPVLTQEEVIKLATRDLD